MKKAKNCIKNKKGITLIALIITIIILLILASLAISIVGENGLIARAKESAFKTKMQGYKEDVIEYSIIKVMNEEETNFNAGKVLKNAIKDGIVTDITESDVTLNLKDIIANISKKDEEYIVVYNGEMCYVSNEKIKNNKNQVKWCEEIGIKILEYTEAEGDRYNKWKI